jgi:hypothetical protein
MADSKASLQQATTSVTRLLAGRQKQLDLFSASTDVKSRKKEYTFIIQAETWSHDCDREKIAVFLRENEEEIAEYLQRVPDLRKSSVP